MIEKKNKDIYISIYCFYSVYTHILKHFKLGYAFSNRDHDCLPSYQMLEKISRFIFGVALVFGFALIRK